MSNLAEKQETMLNSQNIISASQQSIEYNPKIHPNSHALIGVSPFNGYFTPGYEYDPNVYDILKDNSDIFHIYFPNTIDNIAPAWTDRGFQINLGCYVEITEWIVAQKKVIVLITKKN